jgi:hypothetical protein
MTRTDSVFRKRWPALAAAAMLIAVALAVGALLTSNDGEQPVPEVIAAQLQPDLTDPGLYADPPVPAASISDPHEPRLIVAPEAAVPEPPVDGQDPGVNQVVPKGSGALARWLANRPAEMGPFSTQDAMAATQLDLDWMLYQAVEKDIMTQNEADAFRAWFEQRPTVEEAPELLNYLPAQIHRPGENSYTGTNVGTLETQ